ncbi:MAG: hypothetical protein CL402_01735 [Acidiferrobacteraceae bacterium]|nr:hypothetical protein [Acidiferrobacteraceae bacterium]|tara:strand:+ start:707 stop:1675 length:969 start_codon:yes stop_codon:yes gene_type:complete
MIDGNENILVWTPTYQYVAEKIREKKQLRFIIAPFIKRDALNELLNQCEDTSQLEVIVRWNKADIVNQVSDLEIYEDLKNRGIPLYQHSSIHLKMLVFDSNWAFHTSGNITKKGLGLVENPNLEVGAQIRLNIDDWIEIEKLLYGAIRIDDRLYERAMRYREDNKLNPASLPPLTFEEETEKAFSRLSLPATQSPEQLFSIYQDPLAFHGDGDLYASFVHDIALYNLLSNLDRDEFFLHLGSNFESHPFIKAVVAFIKDEGSVHFGKMNGWITERCSEKPTPYRWQLKPSTNRLYDWLVYFFEEITWDQPKHSQVIYWNASP